MNLVDMHCDTLLECYLKKFGLRRNSCQVDLESMKKTGALAQFFAIFLPSGADAKKEGIELSPYDLFQEIYALYLSEMDKNSDIIKPVLSYADLRNNMTESKMSSVLTIEDAELLNGHMSRVDEMYEKGVRLMTLMWNKENCIGFPQSKNREIHKKGLKPFGIEVVERMNELGIIIDVSHMSEGGFYDVSMYSKKPFVASHSCSKSLCKISRNLTDDQLKCIAASGGVVGINYNSSFLRENSRYSTIADIIEHMDYVISVIGEDYVALGSDFDGIDCGLEISDYGKYGNLIKAMLRKYSYERIEKICCKNVCRVIEECL